MTELHEMGCDFAIPVDAQGRQLAHSDAAKRLFDTYNLHRIGAGDLSIGQWFAVRLSDGTTDNVLYGSRAACVRHQKHDALWYAYTKIVPSGMSVCEAESVLYFHRKTYQATYTLLSDPDRQIISPLTREQYTAAVTDPFTIPTGKRR